MNMEERCLQVYKKWSADSVHSSTYFQDDKHAGFCTVNSFCSNLRMLCIACFARFGETHLAEINLGAGAASAIAASGVQAA